MKDETRGLNVLSLMLTVILLVSGVAMVVHDAPKMLAVGKITICEWTHSTNTITFISEPYEEGWFLGHSSVVQYKIAHDAETHKSRDLTLKVGDIVTTEKYECRPKTQAEKDKDLEEVNSNLLVMRVLGGT